MADAAAHRPSAPAVALALAAVYVIWGSTYLAIRWALEGGFTPFALGGIRFLTAGALMFAVLRLRGDAAPTRAQWLNCAVMGVLLLGLGNGMVNTAEKSVSSGLTAVAVASAPIWMTVLAFVRGERPTRLEWLGVAIGFAGVIWLNAGSSLASSRAGLIALALGTLAWAFGSIWSRGRDLPSPFMTAAAQMLCAGVVMSLTALLSGEHPRLPPDGRALAAFVYLVLAGSLLGFTAYVWLLHHVRPALAGSYAYVNPAIAVLLGALLAHERFGLRDLLPMAVIVFAVVAMTLGRKPKPAEPEA